MKKSVLFCCVNVLLALVLQGCGGENLGSSASGSTGNVQATSESVTIYGGGIKGPLADAEVKVFSFDSSRAGYYDANSPIATAVTDRYARISGLSVPANISPPYVLTIGGASAVDLNTNQSPVVATLVTVVTKDMLDARQPIYATPLTTLAFEMAKVNGTPSESSAEFLARLDVAAQSVASIFAIDQEHPIDIFWSPLVIDGSTDTLAMQEEAVYHRAALEAFTAKLHKLASPEGNGLRGTYFNDVNLTEQVLTRTDRNINFNWLDTSPDSTVGANTFSVRWTGLIEPKYSENYTFYTSTDDGVRLWIDGQLIVDQWIPQVEHEFSGSIPLIAGRKYKIVMEYFDQSGQASAKLFWSSANQPKAIVDKASLFSVSNPDLVDELNANTVIAALGRDLGSDGVIDNSANGEYVESIESTVLLQDPMNLLIPNTPYHVKDITALMEAERSLLGVDRTSVFKKDQIALPASEPADQTVASNDTTTTPVPEVTAPTVNEPVTVTETTPTEPVVVEPAPVVTTPSPTAMGVDPGAPEIVFYHDFDNETPHFYTVDDLNINWDGGLPGPTNTIEIVPDPSGGSGNVMKVFIPGGVHGIGPNFRANLGRRDEAYFAYDIMFEDGYDFSKGGKLPGLKGGDTRTSTGGGGPPAGDDGWTGRIMWMSQETGYGVDGAITNYMYLPDNWSIFGRNIKWDKGGIRAFTPGRWQRLEMRYKMNTPGVKDGVLQAWLDGELVLDMQKVMYRTVDTLKIDQIFFNVFHGGGDDTWAPVKDEYIYFDNFVVSTKPITH